MKQNDLDLLTLEKEYDRLKLVLGSKIGECRELSGFPKRTYKNGSKSANILFVTESGRCLPNKDTLNYYIELYQVNDKTAQVLRDLHKQANEYKKLILRKKRGWE
jgi:hypothetical protein